MDLSVSVLWPMAIASCATAAAIFLVIGWPYRTTPVVPLFSLLVAATGGMAYCELWMMRSNTVAEFGTAMRWFHVPAWIAILTIVAIIRTGLRAGRPWLAWTVCGVRTLSLVVNFLCTPNLNFQEITLLKQIQFLGDYVSVAEGVRNPWMLLGQLSLVLLIAFIADAAYTIWRRGDPARTRLVIISTLLFFSLSSAQAQLAFFGIIESPITVSAFCMLIIVAMGTDLSFRLLDVNRWATRLRESEEYSALAMDAGGIGTWQWTLTSNQVRGSARWRAIFGISPSSTISGPEVFERIHEDDRIKVKQAIERTMAGAGECRIEFRVLAPTPPARWIEARGRLVAGSNNKSNRMLGVVIDITERKSSEERFRQLVEASPTGIMLVSRTGEIVLVNSLVETIFGYLRDELIGMPVESLIPENKRSTHPTFRNQFFAAPSARAMGIGRELFAQRKDGTQFPVEIALSPVTFHDETLILVSILDITLRKQAEQDLEQKRTELARMSRVTMLGELSGSLAHELNQPLTSILSNAQAAQRFLAHDPPDIDELRAILNDIVSEDRRAGEIIRRLRRLLERGDVQQHPVDLNSVAQEVLQLLRSDLSNRSITANVYLDPNLPTVSGDHVQLQQVLLNLVMNASDAMADLAPADRALTVRTATDGDDSIHVSVSDRGRGIAADSLEEVFTPFYTTKRHGMGLGLAVCRNIVAAHHGKLWVTRNEERGVTFHLTLPIARND